MKNTNDKFGIIIAVTVTAVLLGVIGSISVVEDGSISSQGQTVIDRTSNELKNAPDILKDITSDALDVADEIIDESDSVPEILDNTLDEIEGELPDVPKIIKQTEGKQLELVSIPQGTDVLGCEKSDMCYLPVNITVSPGGEIIWINHDAVPHTVTSGNARDGPDGLFNSGLIMSGDTYSIKLDLAFEYDYYCLVHPWMQGTIVVE